MLAYVACFFGSLFFVNAIPHFVSGLMGRRFPTPFAKPPGRGMSSPTVNVAWGVFNFAVAYLALVQIAVFDVRNVGHVAISGVAAVAGAIGVARSAERSKGGYDRG